MNDFFRAFVAAGERLASERGLIWNLACDADGTIDRSQRWDLTALAGMVPPPVCWLPDFAYDNGVLAPLNEILTYKGHPPVPSGAMSASWIALLKAAVLNEVLVKRNKPAHAIGTIGRQIRILATCARDVEPWEVTGDHVQLAYNAALHVGGSGKLAANLEMVVKILLDAEHLADRAPLARFCTPYPSAAAQAAQGAVNRLKQSGRDYKDVGSIRKELQERKSASKLPEERAFWELIRIVFTEAPRTFADAVRFTQIKVAVVTGFRVGETAMLPLDWRRQRDYVDANGRPADERGGVSKSLMIRYFAEKQVEDAGANGIVLYENAQHVPPMFEELVEEVLADAERLTRPMRELLRRQTETGRLMPDLDVDELVSGIDLFNRLSGNIQATADPIPLDLVQKYRERHDAAVLGEIRAFQLAKLADGAAMAKVARVYWAEHVAAGLVPYDNRGVPMLGRVSRWPQVRFRVGDVEDLFRRKMQTKLPDTTPFNLPDGGVLYPHELLFLMPIRALAEERDGGITDVTRYVAIGRAHVEDLGLQLGLADNNLFTRYGATEDDRKHKIETHSLRHLQNAELFRLGVADAIITKRFGRRSVAQSHVYDHRSLAEDLAAIDLPDDAVTMMGPKAQEALKLIMTNRVSGPIVGEFRRIQRELGDDAAFIYLDAEADGLHVTPYGFCLNSFMVEACPKHLECFNGCRHLALSPLPKDRTTLELLRDRFIVVIASIEARPLGSVGRANQLKHAKIRLENIEVALATAPGERPFPDGPDLSVPFAAKSGSTVIDGAMRMQRAAD